MADITVLDFDEHVRKRPGMYFGVALGDPRLPTQVLSAVAGHVAHPAASVAEVHSLSAGIDIVGDLCLRVTVDQPHAWQDAPALGYFGSLLGPEWWQPAAAAALCEKASVEMWRDGRGFRQDLAGLRPVSEVEVFDPPTGSGTRMTFTLDPRDLRPGAAFPADLEGIDVHGPYCDAAHGPGRIILRDHRHGTSRRCR
ncbi:hypothetical protein [Nonomuraea terrae]|uniref:hypothetical protein n=1 Tax=Nonomuraea terrae TaxID=2530383 RepID=UPI001CB6D117|nr:hypothetical protein [Nonomuraea terrae]